MTLSAALGRVRERVLWMCPKWTSQDATTRLWYGPTRGPHHHHPGRLRRNQADLAKGANEPPPQRDAAGRFVIYVEETYADQLKALRRFRENYSDVILRLAEPEGTRATVVKLAERG
jgi:hypothetical protein